MTDSRPGRSLDLTPARPHREGMAPPTPVQLAFDELGPSLFDVTFVVVDLETTGGGPGLNSITEFGAVKVRGGDVIGEFSSLVNPHVPIPGHITWLTGITNSMVALAPDLAQVMAQFLAFVGHEPAVFVAHNARFDISHLKVACGELGYHFPAHPVIDTVKLARKVFTKDETPNYKLSTLARVCGAEVQPSHRALDDARATVDLLHAILSRLGGIGVTHLADLLTATDPVPAKRRARAYLADGLPRGPGVYRFIGPGGEVLYVGTSVNVYKRVRQYFTAAERRARMAEMVDLAVAVEATATATQLEANVLEVRLIDELDPPYNRRSRRTAQRPWLVLTNEPFPRLKVTRKVRLAQMGEALGPLTSGKQATRAVELLQAATGLRACTARLPATPDGRSPCHLYELGKCDAPCLTGRPQSEQVAAVQAALAGDVAGVASHTLGRIKALAGEERYEQAAGERDRLYALVAGAKNLEELRSLVGNRRIVAARRSGRGWDVVVMDYGMLRASATTRPGEDPEDLGAWLDAATEQLHEPEFALHVSHDEVRLLSAWLMHEDVRLIKVSRPDLLTRSLAGGCAVQLPQLPDSHPQD
ncbi:DEDD exonuclease domain-containing protein [Trueperella abortisuis]|uniref:DEDD exonuclease domain-containing protein n=1 Tax=Trueperella abortisuis TaxID=445930 RepID=UPI002892A411|nr:DEDD exonuclease domain-containing protein [Trueperella abortisuis]